MRRERALAVIGLSSVLMLANVGCRDDTPSPPRVPLPASGAHDSMALRERDEVRPMPRPSEPRPVAARPPFDDVPLVYQETPEQSEFVEVYKRVGSPRVVLFVNRTMEGTIIPVNPEEPVVHVDQTHSTNGPSDYHEKTSVYLHAGQYDEAQAKTLDYEAVENIMTDWIAAGGKVTVISPTLARQRLTDEQVKEMQNGRPQVLSEVAQQLGADVLIQVQAHPTRQTDNGLAFRLVAEAMNIKGGQSLGRATVDMDPPLEKTAINNYTRFLARKLMADMSGTWSSPPPPEMRRPEGAGNPPMAPAVDQPAVQAPPVQPQPEAKHPMVMPPLLPPVTTAPSTLP